MQIMERLRRGLAPLRGESDPPCMVLRVEEQYQKSAIARLELSRIHDPDENRASRCRAAAVHDEPDVEACGDGSTAI